MLSSRTKRNTPEDHSMVIRDRTEMIAGKMSKVSAHLHKANAWRIAIPEVACVGITEKLETCSFYLCGIKQSHAAVTSRRVNQYSSGPMLSATNQTSSTGNLLIV